MNLLEINMKNLHLGLAARYCIKVAKIFFPKTPPGPEMKNSDFSYDFFCRLLGAENDGDKNFRKKRLRVPV